jgi:hypothetical protein
VTVPITISFHGLKTFISMGASFTSWFYQVGLQPAGSFRAFASDTEQWILGVWLMFPGSKLLVKTLAD